MPTPTFPADRAFAHLTWLYEQAHTTGASDLPAHDPLGLEPWLANHVPGTAAVPLPQLPGGPPAGANIGGTLPGRQSGPALVVVAAYRPPPSAATRDATPWGADADASGLALVLTLAEVLADAPPLHQTQLVLLATPEAAPDAGAQTLAGTLGPEVQGVVVAGQVAGPGAHLDVDVRSLLDPRTGALFNEFFLLGRALGHTPFAGGAEMAFPGPHVAFMEAGVPAVCLSDTKNPSAGTGDDRPERCDAATLGAVGDVVLRVLHGERVV